MFRPQQTRMPNSLLFGIFGIFGIFGPQIAQFLALVVASNDTQRWVCAASVRSEGCSSADRLGHAVVAGSGPKGWQGSSVHLAALGKEADEVSFFGIAKDGGDAKEVALTALGPAPAPP